MSNRSNYGQDTRTNVQNYLDLWLPQNFNLPTIGVDSPGSVGAFIAINIVPQY